MLLTRRQALISIASIAALSPIVALTGCGGGGSSATNLDNSSGSGGSSSSGGSSTPTTNNGNWLSGGTQNMTANFPEDNIFANASTCTVELTGQQTEGPCYFDSDYLDDISAGQTGLPMMLCLQLIDSACNPLAGYEIEVWHCDVRGVYSADTSGAADTRGFNSSFCSGNDSAALASKWFRGIAVTDSSGRVNFKTCFPGWYSGRAIHIHFRVRQNNLDSLVSQFGFDDTFCDDICSTHSDYASRGTPNTHLTNDTVFGNDYAKYLFDLEQNQDGSLLGYKRIII